MGAEVSSGAGEAPPGCSGVAGGRPQGSRAPELAACWAFAATHSPQSHAAALATRCQHTAPLRCRARPHKCRGPEGPQRAWDESTSRCSSARTSASIPRSNALLAHDSRAKQHATFLQPLVTSRSGRAISPPSPCLVVSEFLNITHVVPNNRLILPKKNALI